MSTTVMKNEHELDLRNHNPQAIGGDMDALQVVTNTIRMKNYERFTRRALARSCNESYMISILLLNDNWAPLVRNFEDGCPNKMCWFLAKDKRNGEPVALNVQHFYISKTHTDPVDPELAMRYNDVSYNFNNPNPVPIETDDEIMSMDEIKAHLDRHEVPIPNDNYEFQTEELDAGETLNIRA